MVEKVAWWLVLIGALNWLLVGLFQLDLVAALLSMLGSPGEFLTRAVYILVGIAGVYLLPQAFGAQMIPKRPKKG
jgi:uncharacterized membrane protein YuzA (DUF378 family)